MNKTLWGLAAGTAALGFMTAAAEAATFGLFEYAFNIDGTVANPPTDGDPVPGAVNLSGFNTSTGLGSVFITVTGAGSHSVGLFVDHEIDEAINGFSNEFGGVSGSPAAGQSWEIDEPGYTFGNIYTNFAAGTLDNSNGVDVGSPDDVSMALAWDFTLNAGEYATLSFVLSQSPPTIGFALSQTDPDSDASLYFSSGVSVTTVPPSAVPIPAAWLLFGSGLATLAAFRRRSERREGAGA